MRFTLYTPHTTLFTLHSALYTLHFATPHSSLCTLHSTLFTLHFTLHTLHFTLYTPHSSLYTPHSTLYTLTVTGEKWWTCTKQLKFLWASIRIIRFVGPLPWAGGAVSVGGSHRPQRGESAGTGTPELPILCGARCAGGECLDDATMPPWGPQRLQNGLFLLWKAMEIWGSRPLKWHI